MSPFHFPLPIAFWALLFTFLLFPCFSLQAQPDLCPIEVTEGPCFENGNPCTFDQNEDEPCLQFTEQALEMGFAFGATLTFNYSDLSSGNIDFDDFMQDLGCPNFNDHELRSSKASRRRRPSSISAKTDATLAKVNLGEICAEWEVIWNYGEGFLRSPDSTLMFEKPCQFVVVKVLDDGGNAPIPLSLPDLVFDANEFLGVDNFFQIRSNPRLFIENFAAFAAFDYTDDPEFPFGQDVEAPCTKIKRTWTLTDWSGNETIFHQQIYLLDFGVVCVIDSDNDSVCDVCDVCQGWDDRIDEDLDEIPDGCDYCFGDNSTGDANANAICDDLDACANGNEVPGLCESFRMITPQANDILDNNCQDRSDTWEWYFKWTPFPFAEKYHLYVLGPSATIPLINNAEITNTFYHEISEDGYIINANAQGWTVWVRAFFAGTWTAWSPGVIFDVEPLNTDCQVLCLGQDLTLNTVPIASNTYRAANTIKSAGTICSGSKVKFLAGSVHLLPDFKTEAGSNFHAAIDNCQPAAAIAEPINQLERFFEKKPEALLSLSVYPNPFAQETKIRYILPKAEYVSLYVTDFSGRKIIIRINHQLQEAGTHEWIFNSNDLSQGIYFITIIAGREQVSKRAILLE